jgi:hypothetical protein
MGASIWPGVNYPELSFVQVTRTDSAGGQRITVVSPQAQKGFYFWIPYLNVLNSDGNGQGMDLFLLDPSVWQPSFTLPFPTGTGPPTPNGFLKIADFDGGLGGTSMTAFQSANNKASTPLYKRRIVVPSLFGLAAMESNNVVSGSARTVTLRFMYSIIENGCSPPIF